MRFTKMHGIGNDYVYINGFQQHVRDPATLAPVISDRHTGVGGDGLILILPPDAGVDADARMRMFNNDGSEAQMCGNGIRCVAKFVVDHGISSARPLRIQTGRGVLSLDYSTSGGKVQQVTVDMGTPILDPRKVPVDSGKLTATDQAQTFRIDDRFIATFVSMGNPHAVIYHEKVEGLDLWRLGAELEHHPAFPQRMNIHFVQVVSPGEVTVQHWERGSGATQACGTGACAVAVAGVLTGRTQRTVLAHLPGGDLKLQWRESDDHVLMTGPAVEVFSGDWPD
ncbi:MAG: diaminopimelate epimerase [Phycisphaeraceae bacterium]|nr:diaminopimelate epimerase [Phycisphaeraceae bacterium]